MIKLRYSSCDGYRVTKSYKTLAGAQAYAHRMIGRFPETGMSYAISGDGIGKITVEGATLRELFPAPEITPASPDGEREDCY